MLASMPEDFAVFVLLSLLAVLLSSTRMVRMSPTARARVSETSERDVSAFQRDDCPKMETEAIEATTAILKHENDRLLILNLSTKFFA